jgi:hypothetical protein
MPTDTLIDELVYYARLPDTWLRQIASNVRGIASVVDLIWLRPAPLGAVAIDHPFCTGLRPDTGEPIWPDNIAFATSPRPGLQPLDDAALVSRTGRFMANMVSQAARGKRGRMPPAVNYLHGGVHYNGAWLIFNDAREAIRTASDRGFRRELRRLVRVERREPLLVLRDPDYDPDELAELVCAMRSILPWFSNSQGPKRRVLWGNPSPHPVIAVITGAWIADVRAFLAGRAVAREPLERGRYFAGTYRGWRDRALAPERALAWATERRIRARGERENLFFVDATRLRNRDHLAA